LHRIISWIVIAAVGISYSFAEPVRDTAAPVIERDSGATRIKNLDKMVVLGKRTPLQTVLDAKDFSGKFTDLQSALQSVSGVTVRSLGGFGHYAEASIRGSSPNQIQVFLDGIPLNGSTGSAVDLSKIPFSALQKITIFKNAPSIEIFGDNAGGVISLTSSTTTDVASASGEVGSFGYRAGSALLEKRLGKMTHNFSINYGYADNSYPYVNDRGTTIGPNAHNDDTLENMDNNFFSSLSSMYSNRWDISGTCNLASQLCATVTDEGIFYFPQADSNDGHIRNTKLYLIESFNSALGPNASLRITAQGKTDNELFQRFRPFYLFVLPTRHEIDRPYGSVDVFVKEQFGRTIAISGILKGSYDGFTFTDLYSPDNRMRPHFYRISGKAGIEADVSIIEKISARIGGLYRLELDSTNGKFYFSGFLPGGTSSFHAFPNGFSEVTYEPANGLALVADARYASRSPGFSEKFSLGATYSGNADLRPETRLEGSIGFSINKPFMSFSGSLFGSNTKDKIVFLMNSLHLFVPQNLDDVKGWGFESDLTFAPLDWVSMTNNLTYMENTIYSSGVSSWIGKEEPLVPRISDDFSIRFSYKKLYAWHSMHFISPYFLSPDNVQPIYHSEPELTARIGIVPDKDRHFDLSLRLENYLNVQNYDFPDGPPLPGIRYFFVLKYDF
jgi:hypothetical protein